MVNEMPDDSFDMFKFGGLVKQVETLQLQVNAMDKDIKQLLAMANQSKGGLWAGMAIASFVGGLVTYFTSWFSHK
jgi:hypothetical protein